MWITEFSVPAGPGAPGAIRRAVESISDLPADARADLRLLGGEIATSPALAGRGDAPVTLMVRLGRRGHGTKLEIVASMGESARRDRADEPPGPEGAPLLERVCARWGMARSATTTAIWFEVDDRPGPEPVLCRLPDSPRVALVAG